MKAYLNIALVKCMSSNHKQAMQILEKAQPYIEENNKLLRFKYLLKKATLLKKGSYFRESRDLLNDLEKEICEYMEIIQEGQENVSTRRLAFQA